MTCKFIKTCKYTPNYRAFMEKCMETTDNDFCSVDFTIEQKEPMMWVRLLNRTIELQLSEGTRQ